MVLTQKNYTQKLSKELLKQAEKSQVRELDEIEKGRFQAYVDEKENSYDVLLVINNNGEITEHSCDCNKKTVFCPHKAALLISLEKGQKSDSPKIKNNKKARPFEGLLEEVGTDELKNWVKILLLKNKDLELAFLHQFSGRQKQYKPEDIKQLTIDAVKAVAGNRKKLETAEAKKIVELWTEVHDPIIVNYNASASDNGSFLNLHALVETCNEVTLKVSPPGRQFNKYIEHVLLKVIEALNNLQDENAWEIATKFFITPLNNVHWEVREYYLAFLMHLHEIIAKERKEKLIQHLISQYTQSKSKKTYQQDTYTRSIFNLVKKNGSFDKYYNIFEPLPHQYEYNEELIGLLINVEQLNIAEKYCLELQRISGQEESTGYLGYLKKIYVIKKDNKKLAAVLTLLIPHTFDFRDFITIYEQMEGDEKKKYRTKILTRAGHMHSYNKDARLFSFMLMDYEQNYKKMIEYIGSDTPYDIIVQFAEKMIMVNKQAFITKLLNRSYSSWLATHEEQRQIELFQQLLNIMIKYYPMKELKMYIQQFDTSRHWYKNAFVEYVRKNLNEK